MEQKSLPARSEVKKEETWNLENLFPSVDEWRAAFEVIETAIPDLLSYQGKLNEKPETLLSFLKAYEKIMILAEKIYMYASLPTAVDTTDQDALGRLGQAHGLVGKLRSSLAFVEPELMAVGFATLKKWCTDNEDLKIYATYVQQLEDKSTYIQSGEVEKAIALAGQGLQSSAQTHTALTNADMKFKPALNTKGEELEVGQSNIGALITHKDRKVRETAWQNYADGYLDMKNTLAAIQTGGLHRDVYNMRVRGYESSLEASLKPNQVPLEVFHNLIDVFKANLPTWHRYWKLRKEYMGVDNFHPYDIKAPLGESPAIPYEQAIEWISAGMTPLGEEYVSILNHGATVGRWVDRAVNKGKRQGAFSAGVYDSNPFIMMSYSNDVFSLSTLAHELGHSMHSYYSRRTQPYVYGRYSLFVAEVASNFNQALVRKYMFDHQTDPGFQLALIEETMSNFHRYFFIMPTLARWELEVHDRLEKGKPLNANIMNQICAEYFKEAYGDEVAFDHDRVGITWAQFQHMYMNFYVYQYATGISGAHALADRVLAGEPGAVDDYLGFLSAGCSKYPLDALKDAGVDMTSTEPVQKAFNFLAGVVDRFENEFVKK